MSDETRDSQQSPIDRVLDQLEGVKTQAGGYLARCPAHEDRKPSLSIGEGEDERVLLTCHAGCSTESVVSAIGLEMSDLFAHQSARMSEPEAVYSYTDADGATLFEVVRLAGKRFLQRRPDPDAPDMYIWNRDGVEPVLYRLPRLLVAVAGGETIYVAEGEKDVASLERLGVTATCNPGGAGKWRPEYGESLRGANVIVVADRDEPGLRHAAQIVQMLDGVAASAEVVQPLEGKDAADHLAAGYGIADFRALAEALTEELAALLDDVASYLHRYIVVRDEQADAMALWVVHTHTFDAAEATPYIQVTSAEKRSGKSQLLDVLHLLVREPWMVISPTEAALFRVIQDRRPTVFIDEYDTIFNRKEYEGIRAILNGGFRPGTSVPRVVPDGHGFQVQTFDVYCPKILAGIGEVPDTIGDRSIRIELKRRARHEHRERARRRDITSAAEPIHNRLARLAPGAEPILAGARPLIPEQLDDRAADMWESLLAIADLAGPRWGSRARHAAVMLATGESREEESQGLVLLSDIRAILDRSGAEYMSSFALIERLADDQESPWVEWWDDNGKKTARGAQQRLARLLKPYGIKSKNIRDGQLQFKGYERTDFVDAWARYLPPGDVQSVPPVPDVDDHPDADSDGTTGTANGPGTEDAEAVWN